MVGAHHDAAPAMGRRIETSDCWIAATAVRHALPLVTHNAGDFADIPELKVITHSGR
jgi:tRNA(fMet)-specific endonuclease VapC